MITMEYTAMKIYPFILPIIIAVLLLAGCVSLTRSPVMQTGQTAQSFEKPITRVVTCNYLLFLPEGYNDSKENWPLIMFLHGAGERGDDLEKVKIHGPPKLVESDPDFPFIIVSPQCPKDEWWSVEVLDALLDEIVTQYRVDENRIYLTGLSMGGFGTWHYAAAHPERLAAIAPICGGGDPKTADAIKDIPAWVFHGAKDDVVPVSKSQEMVDVFKACDADVQFTIYPDAGHDSWTETYNNKALYDFFLSHEKGK
jgi:predicted peptidase